MTVLAIHIKQPQRPVGPHQGHGLALRHGDMHLAVNGQLGRPVPSSAPLLPGGQHDVGDVLILHRRGQPIKGGHDHGSHVFLKPVDPLRLALRRVRQRHGLVRRVDLLRGRFLRLGQGIVPHGFIRRGVVYRGIVHRGVVHRGFIRRGFVYRRFVLGRGLPFGRDLLRRSFRFLRRDRLLYRIFDRTVLMGGMPAVPPER